MEIHFQRVSGAKLEVANDHAGYTLRRLRGDRPVTPPAPSSPALRALPLAPPAAAANEETRPTELPSPPCPACDNEQTVAVSVIFDALTLQTRSRKSGNGLIPAVERLWNNAQTAGDASARYTQRSQFAKRFAPPPMDCARLVEVSRSRVAVAGSAAFVACLIVMLPLVLLNNKGPSVPAGSDLQRPGAPDLAWAWQALSAIALFGVPGLVFAKVSSAFDAKIAQIRQEEWRAFDERKRAWKNSFFCCQCDTVFHPANGQKE